MYPPTFWPLGWAIRSSKCTELLSQWGLCLQVRSWSKGPRYAPYNGLDAQGGGGLLCCSLLGSFCLFSLSLSKKLIKFLNFFFVKYQVNLDWFPYPDRELWCLHRAHWVTTGVVAGKRLSEPRISLVSWFPLEGPHFGRFLLRDKWVNWSSRGGP